jgi:hypothetical protein
MPKKRRPLSVRQPPTDGRPKNRLLALLPDEDLHHLRRHLETVPVRGKQAFHKAGERLRHVYFLNGGVCSLTTALSNGAIVEAATIGDCGFVGIEAFLSDDAVSLSEAIMRVPDTDAERLSVKAFRRAHAHADARRRRVDSPDGPVIRHLRSGSCLRGWAAGCSRWRERGIRKRPCRCGGEGEGSCPTGSADISSEP